MDTTSSFHTQVGAALREQYGRLAQERLANGEVPPHFTVRFPGAPIPYRVVVFSVTDSHDMPFVHAETLVAAEALDWDTSGLAQALLTENGSRLFAHYTRRGDHLVAEADYPAETVHPEALSHIVDAVAAAAVAARELLAAAGLLTFIEEDDD